MRDMFEPLKAKPKPREIYAFDVEGNGDDGGFVCGAIVGAYTYNFFTDASEMLMTLIEYGASGAWLFSHNLEYDLPVIAGDRLFEFDMIFSHEHILKATYHIDARVARFYDSVNLFPRWSVATLGDAVGLPKLDLPSGVLSRLSAGYAWSSFTPDEQRLIERYCRRDAEIVYRAVSMLQEIALSFSGNLCPTISGVSMDIFRRSFMRESWRIVGEKTNALIRPAFYGGRVENFRMGYVPGCNMFDITSLYPYVQATVQFPHPNHLRLIESPPVGGDFWKWEGVAEAEVTIPDRFVPFLPYRFDGRLFFPVGRMRGCWTLLELREAVIRGAVVHDIHWVIGSPVLFNPFVEFVNTLFDRRRVYLNAGDHRANLIKLLLNSLYGRFGLNPDNGLSRLFEVSDDSTFQRARGCYVRTIGDRLVAYERFGDGYYPPYVNVFFAAQVTSAARVLMLQALEGQDIDLVYCDTDSIITMGKLPTGDGLGEWRCQMENGDALMLRPKEYILHNEYTGYRAVAKSVPPDLAMEYIRTGVARFMRAVSIRESLTRSERAATWVEVIRSRQPTYPKRYPISNDVMVSEGSCVTLPYDVSELPLLSPRAVSFRGRMAADFSL